MEVAIDALGGAVDGHGAVAEEGVVEIIGGGGRSEEGVAHVQADAVCLAGTTAGSEIPEEDLRGARRGAEGHPVIAGTGVRVENVERMLSLADGVIMGTSVKVDRDTFKPVDPLKAAEFIRCAKDARDKMQ